MPILQSMSCGTPVGMFYLTSFPKVAEDSALLFNLFNEEDMKKAIHKVLSSRELQLELIEKGYKRRQEFSWLKTAQRTEYIYEKVMKL